MIRLAILLAAGTATVAPNLAVAQTMGGMSMPGMQMPAPVRRAAAKPVAKKTVVPRAPTRAARRPATGMPVRTTAPATSSEPGHDMSAMPGMDMSQNPPAAMDPAMPGMDHPMPGMDMNKPAPVTTPQPMPGMDMAPGSQDAHSAGAGPMTGMEMTGTALPAGNAAPPAPPTDHYAARLFPAGEIERAHLKMARESGGQTFAQIMFNLAEVQVRNGRDGYRWDGQAWFGADLDRLVIKTEGEGVFREGIESAEVQALYSRAIDPYFNVQVGVRHDFQPTPSRTYATIGIEGLAPYWFEVSGALFLSNKGDILGRLEGYYDQRITQRLILQPRVELNFAAQNVPENRIGVGLSDAELGLRLRYEISRQFAPYIGISYAAKTGQTASYARADGKNATSGSLVAGVHFWF